MNKILLSILLSSSFLLADNFDFINSKKEDHSLLNSIKEQNGIKLTKQEEYTNFIKSELLKTFSYYVNNKLLSKTDEYYLKNFNDINKISSIEDLFKIENNSFKINNIKGDKEEFFLSDLIFRVSVSNDDIEFLKIFLANSNSVNYNFNFSSLKKDIATEKYNLIFSNLLAKKSLLTKFIYFNNTNLNSFSSLENLFNYGNYYSFVNMLNLEPSYNFHLEDYIYLIKNEGTLKSKNVGFYEIFKNALNKEISNNKIIKETNYIYSKEPLFIINKYNLYSYSLIKYDIEIPLVNILLKATNDKDLVFPDFLSLYNTNVSSENISNLYTDYYKIDSNNIKISNVEEKIITYNNGLFYKTFSKEEFQKRFSKFINSTK